MRTTVRTIEVTLEKVVAGLYNVDFFFNNELKVYQVIKKEDSREWRIYRKSILGYVLTGVSGKTRKQALENLVVSLQEEQMRIEATTEFFQAATDEATEQAKNFEPEPVEQPVEFSQTRQGRELDTVIEGTSYLAEIQPDNTSDRNASYVRIYARPATGGTYRLVYSCKTYDGHAERVVIRRISKELQNTILGFVEIEVEPEVDQVEPEPETKSIDQEITEAKADFDETVKGYANSKRLNESFNKLHNLRLEKSRLSKMTYKDLLENNIGIEEIARYFGIKSPKCLPPVDLAQQYEDEILEHELDVECNNQWHDPQELENLVNKRKTLAENWPELYYSQQGH